MLEVYTIYNFICKLHLGLMMLSNTKELSKTYYLPLLFDKYKV